MLLFLLASRFASWEFFTCFLGPFFSIMDGIAIRVCIQVMISRFLVRAYKGCWGKVYLFVSYKSCKLNNYL